MRENTIPSLLIKGHESIVEELMRRFNGKERGLWLHQASLFVRQAPCWVVEGVSTFTPVHVELIVVSLLMKLRDDEKGLWKRELEKFLRKEPCLVEEETP